MCYNKIGNINTKESVYTSKIRYLFDPEISSFGSHFLDTYIWIIFCHLFLFSWANCTFLQQYVPKISIKFLEIWNVLPILYFLILFCWSHFRCIFFMEKNVNHAKWKNFWVSCWIKLFAVALLLFFCVAFFRVHVAWPHQKELSSSRRPSWSHIRFESLVQKIFRIIIFFSFCLNFGHGSFIDSFWFDGFSKFPFAVFFAFFFFFECFIRWFFFFQ